MWRHILRWIKFRSISHKRNQLQIELDVIIDQLKDLEFWKLEFKTSKVICLRSDCVLLSGGLRLDRDSLLHLKEGDFVHVERSSTRHPWKIIGVVDTMNEVQTEIECITLDEEVVSGSVVSNDKGYLIIEPDLYSVDQSEIKCSFAPKAGDEISITVADSKVVAIAPHTFQIIDGLVSQWDGSIGRISKDGSDFAFFGLYDCSSLYIPSVGDLVCAEVIKNKSIENVEWRALKVMLEQNAKDKEEMTDPEVLELLAESCEISIGNNFDCGSFSLGNKGRAMPVIRNMSREPRVLTAVYPCTKVSPMPQFKLVSEHVFPIKLEVDDSVTLAFECNPKQEGIWRDMYVFDFERGKLRMGRFFSVEVFDGSQKRGDHYRRCNGDSTEGKMQGPVIKPNRKLNVNPFRRRVQKHILPENIRKLVIKLHYSCRDNIVLALKENFTHLAEKFSIYNYIPCFKVLLQLEEAEADIGMEKWNLKGVSIFKDHEVSDCYSVPALLLTERRPSVLVGDIVKVQHSAGGPIYEGNVEETNQGMIKFKLNSLFPYSETHLYNVSFLINLANFKFQHAAIDAAWKNLGEEVLFPEKLEVQEPQVDVVNKLSFSYSLNSKSCGGWFNPTLNPSQRAAVYNILMGTARPMPYVIFGPPGTGKTVTMIETILQINKLVPDARILVATPSNSAADLITELLVNAQPLLQPKVLTRLVAFNYRRTIPSYLQKYSVVVKWDGSNDVLSSIATNKITVGTCSSLARLCMQQKQPYYSHVVVDEAGQASEPETMCAVALLGKPRQIVLAGDPKQLGPVILGRIAVQGGLDISWLSRLLDCALYSRQPDRFPDTQGYNPQLITMLTVNYRTVPEILELASHLFYNNQLVPMVSQTNSKEARLVQSMANELPTGCGNTPSLVFHGLRGRCCRDSDSPSWYNPNEANQVCSYIRKLLSKNVMAWDIGVITFYAKQTAKVRELLRSNDIRDVKVGSVEEFQGQERMVIILSTVRVITMEDDSMGFISNPNRINVAITRARALLIVVGDPHLLMTDRNWRVLLKDCVKRNAYIGCDLPFGNT